jgi:hypothetical protein
MAKFGGLIKGQDIAFDTHQQGDSQATRLNDLHLEKRLHAGGKIRFPFFGNEPPSSSRKVSPETFQRVTKEVAKTLHRDAHLTEELGKLIVNQLVRFSSGDISVENAQVAASRIASYFDLGADFETAVARFAGKVMVEFTSHHKSLVDERYVEIRQSAEEVRLRNDPRAYRVVIPKKKAP